MAPMKERIVITGVGLTSPNGNCLSEYRRALLNNVSGIQPFETRHMGSVLAGLCDFDELRYQKRKARRRGTRAGSISIYCGNEALKDGGIEPAEMDPELKRKMGVFIGITEHGNVETENEIWLLHQNDKDTGLWSHHHNPRTVANNPAGELCLNLGITGPHVCLGAACAAGNWGILYAAQLLQLGEVEMALCGGVSESPHTFGIFASFSSQGALAHHEDPTKASRPFDRDRNGIVVSEGGCLYLMETLEHALKRKARIYAELIGYAANTDATDFVLPNSTRQAECFRAALEKASLTPDKINIVNAHATATPSGDAEEARAIHQVFGDFPSVNVNATKGFIGHCMGAAGALELAGNLPSFEDGLIHPTLNFDHPDPNFQVRGLVTQKPKEVDSINTILNVSSGMLGTNTATIFKKWSEV